jgi:hypothetical protein
MGYDTGIKVWYAQDREFTPIHYGNYLVCPPLPQRYEISLQVPRPWGPIQAISMLAWAEREAKPA